MVIESYLRRILGRRPVDQLRDASPIDGAHAHGAGFAGGVEGRLRQVKLSDGFAGRSDGEYLRVGGGVVAVDDLVPALAQDPIIHHDQCAERAAMAEFDASCCQGERLLHEMFMSILHEVVFFFDSRLFPAEGFRTDGDEDHGKECQHHQLSRYIREDCTVDHHRPSRVDHMCQREHE